MIYFEQQGQGLFLARLTIEEANTPLDVLFDYFSGASLPRRLENVQQLIASAANEQEWNYQKNHSPYTVVAQQEKLLEAAFLLQRDRTVIAFNDSKIAEDTLYNPTVEAELYCRPNIHRPTWDYIPKHLERDEFINPYLAFIRAFDCRDLPGWRHLLSELMEFATLGKHSIYEITPDFNVQEIFSLLYKVVEAAHLIDIRENKRDQ